MSKKVSSNPSPIGEYLNAWHGYSTDPSIRENAASGGVVTSVFNYLLTTKQIDAALVCRSFFKEGKLQYELFLAKNLDELRSAQTSKYFDIPMLKGIELIKDFEGKVAVVGLPSQITSIQRRISSNAELAQKIVFTIAIFCGHNSKDDLLYRVLDRKGIERQNIQEFYYRKGLWRGQMMVKLKSGEELAFPFQEFSHYQNLHFLSLTRCLNCCDHMGYNADLSTGDIWNPEFKKDSIKNSIFLARTEIAQSVINGMIEAGHLRGEPVDRRSVYLSQMRSINYHFNLSARSKVGKLLGFNIRDRVQSKVKIRDLIGAFIVLLNHKISNSPKATRILFKMPRFVILGYIYFFKAMMHYERKDY